MKINQNIEEVSQIIDLANQSMNNTNSEDLNHAITILENNRFQEIVYSTGNLYFQINKALYHSQARDKFIETIQYHTNYEFTLKSKMLQDVVKLLNDYHKLLYIGNSFSFRPGNFIIYNGFVNPYPIIRLLKYPKNLIPHVYRDIKIYREIGIIDLETNEGIVGTNVPSENILIDKPWDFRLIDMGFLRLEVFRDGVASYYWKTNLTDEERENLYKSGIPYLEELAENFRYYVNDFKERAIIE